MPNCLQGRSVRETAYRYIVVVLFETYAYSGTCHVKERFCLNEGILIRTGSCLVMVADCVHRRVVEDKISELTE